MHHIVRGAARFMAIVGGLVLCALIVLTCVSILGRSLNTLGHTEFVAALSDRLAQFLTRFGPINGDFELLEAGVAFAIFAFLPICQRHSSHATVDVFTNALPRRMNQALRAFWEIVLTGAMILITWRLFEGLQGKMTNGETTYLLEFPVWWSYGLSFVAAVVASLVGVYTAACRAIEFLTDRSILTAHEELGH